VSSGKPSRKRVHPGDILEIDVEGRYAYVQALGKHPILGWAVCVLTDALDSPCQRPEDLVPDRGYVAFYSIDAAAREGDAQVVARGAWHRDVPERMRARHHIDRSGRVLDWEIDDSSHPSGYYVTQLLTDEERQLPIAEIWPHEVLCAHIRSGWRPEQFVDVPPSHESSRSTDDRLDTVPSGTTYHYLYLPTESAARQAEASLTKHGYEVPKCRPGADKDQWLLLVRQPIAADDDATAKALEEMAIRLGGEYDGSQTSID